MKNRLKNNSFVNHNKIIPYFFMMAVMLTSLDYASSQRTVISSGTGFYSEGGSVVMISDLINNGTFTNRNNQVVFAGISQALDGSSPATFSDIAVEAGTSVTINRTGQTLSGVLKCNGILTSGGNLTLLSDSTGTALIDGSGTGQVIGDIIMQRYLRSGFGYRYFSSPFQTSTVAEFSDDIDLLSSSTAVYKYDESKTASGWVNYKVLSNTLFPFTGYAVNVGNNQQPLTIDMSGVVNNGELSLTLYNHNNAFTKGFNLVGNPYPSPIDWNSPSGWTKTNIDDAVYYFNSSVTDQYGGTYSTYMNGISSNGSASNIIASMQGFFVHVTDGSYPVSATLSVNNEARINGRTADFSPSESKGDKSLVRFVAGYTGNQASYDPFVIYYDEKATTGYDGQLDALKLFNTDAAVTNFYVFTSDGTSLSINALPFLSEESYTLRLGLKTSKSGEVEFKIKDITGVYLGQRITLSDVTSGITADLTAGNSYKIFLNSGDYQNRFFLNYNNVTTDVTENSSPEETFKAYSFHGVLKTEINIDFEKPGRLLIYNLSGQLLYSTQINNPGYHELYPGLKDGIYFVTFQTKLKRFVTKLHFSN